MAYNYMKPTFHCNANTHKSALTAQGQSESYPLRRYHRHVRCLGKAALLAAGLGVAGIPAAADSAYAREQIAQQQACENSGGRWSGSQCIWPSQKSDKYATSEGGGKIFTAFGVIILGAIACAATHCLEKRAKE